MRTIQNAFDQIKTIPGFEDAFLFWTGDNTAHDSPSVSEEEVTDTLVSIISEVQSAFSSKMD